MATIKSLKIGEFFKRKENSNKVYQRGPYDRYEKRYQCDDWEDINRAIYLKGTTEIFTNFEF